MKYLELEDRELFRQLKKGDDAAFHAIYERYKGVLHLHAYKKIGNFEEAQDLIHELFETLWEKQSALPETTNLSGYLYTAVRNSVFNVFAHQKVQARYVESFQLFYNEQTNITDEEIRANELSKQIENEINALPEKMREVFILSRKQYLSHKEIAEKLDISEFTVKNHIKKALKILRNKLSLAGYMYFLIKYFL